MWRPKPLASAAQGESSSAAVVVFLATAAVLQVVLAAGCTFLAGFCAATGAVIVVPLVVAAASSEIDAIAGCLTGASDCRTTENCSLCQTDATAASPVLGCVRPKCPHASASFLLSRPAGFVAEILA